MSVGFPWFGKQWRLGFPAVGAVQEPRIPRSKPASQGVETLLVLLNVNIWIMTALNHTVFDFHAE